MAEENQNNGEAKNGGENSAGSTAGNNSPQPSATSTPNPSQPPFKEPAVLDAVVDPKTKQKEGATPFSFTSPKAMQAEMAQPTKGDVIVNETKKPYSSLSELDAAIARDEKSAKELTVDDYLDSATMFVDAWESALIMICRAISKDTSDSAYGFPVATREKLIRHGVKVSRKRGWVIPIELLAGGTLLAATTQIAMKAMDKRKDYLKLQKKDKTDGLKETPSADPEIIKGGPNKGNKKTRGPGNPR